jgi:hypothetical protein
MKELKINVPKWYEIDKDKTINELRYENTNARND